MVALPKECTETSVPFPRTEKFRKVTKNKSRFVTKPKKWVECTSNYPVTHGYVSANLYGKKKVAPSVARKSLRDIKRVNVFNEKEHDINKSQRKSKKNSVNKVPKVAKTFGLEHLFYEQKIKNQRGNYEFSKLIDQLLWFRILGTSLDNDDGSKCENTSIEEERSILLTEHQYWNG